MSLLTAVGSFDAGSGTQSVPGLGFQPVALVLWTTGGPDGAWRAGHRSGVGLAANGAAYAIGTGADDGLTTPRRSARSAAKALTLVDGPGNLVAEADLLSFDADGFTHNRSAAPASAFRVHYLALGGAISANLVTWTGGNAAGAQSFAGVGFRPDTLIHLYTGLSAGGFGATTTALGNLPGALLGWGVATAAGQWGLHVSGQDQSLANVKTFLRTDASLVYGDFDGTIDTLAAHQSFDADGFTLNWDRAAHAAGRAFTLALQLGTSHAGTLTEPPATGRQQVTGVGAAPRAVLLASRAYAPGYALGTTGATGALGAARPGVGTYACFQDATGSPSVVSAYGSSSAALGMTQRTDRTLDGEAALNCTLADGFALDWSTVGGGMEVAYLALGAGVATCGGASFVPPAWAMHVGSPFASQAFR